MTRVFLCVAFTLCTIATPLPALAQTPPAAPPPTDASRPFEITDNSFLIEEAFNQGRGIFQNIFTWTRGRHRTWDASFTQEWPAPGMAHQLSYTLPFAGNGYASGLGDVMINYRYQYREEDAAGPAVSPRLSVMLPTGSESDGLGAGTTGFQLNLPVSKQYGNFYVHGNAGYTWQGDVQRTLFLGGSGIWRVAPMLNLMLEMVVDSDDTFTISPGVRKGWNFGSHQLVIGAAIPLTRAGGRTARALFTYLSYELPFRK